MSLAEQLPYIEAQPVASAAREVALVAFATLSATECTLPYRPDFMSESFAHDVAGELEELGMGVEVKSTWLKNIHSTQGSSFALGLSAPLPSNVIPFRQRS